MVIKKSGWIDYQWIISHVTTKLLGENQRIRFSLGGHMIKYIRVKKHKALVQPQTMELGHINVICGRNNSGKTTVLEVQLDGN